MELNDILKSIFTPKNTLAEHTKSTKVYAQNKTLKDKIGLITRALRSNYYDRAYLNVESKIHDWCSDIALPLKEVKVDANIGRFIVYLTIMSGYTYRIYVPTIM